VKIIILGAGQVGRTAAYHLAREEANDVTVVDVDDELLRDLQDRIDIRTVAGNAASPRTLQQAGAGTADMIVAMTNSDEVNVVACQIAWTLYGTRTKIARIRSREITSRRELLVPTDSGGAPTGDGNGPKGFAVDMFVSPEALVTDYIERLIRYPGALQVLDFANGQVRLVGLRALKGGLLVGQELRTLREHLPNVDSRVIAIYRNGRSIKPDGGTVIESGDEVFFLAATKDIRRVMSEMRRLEDPARSVVIAGGGNIGLRLAQELEDGNQVKIIERDPRRARRLAEELRNAIVLNGDAADEELLVEENIDSADTFVALTNSEEANILSAMLAKRLGCAKVMALITKPAYAELMESGPIDIAISPQTITIGSLLAYVRRGDIERVHSLRRGAAEAMEAIAHGSPGGPVVGRRVEEIPLPDGATIGAIVRGDEVIMAHHDTIVQANDHVIVFLSDRRQISAIGRLFQT
jgi:trk system potassium uptake protein TrkA